MNGDTPYEMNGDTPYASYTESSRPANGTTSASSITFHDLSYEVPQRKFHKRLPNKTILNSVSGEMKAGVNAIMGPTGCGKTTLLDLLADRKNKSGKSGKVLMNGQRRPTNYKSIVGYVVQDDVVLGSLSVRENLQFSAALRLAGHMTASDRKQRVERVIEILNLFSCADTKVGNEFFRGVSGGERKRTNIGMELITEPQVLFLDEPTTGLDAHTAASVVSQLKDLSVKENRVIILSIHQPRYSIFKLFDSLSLLSKGEVVYHGPASLALDYFDRLGFTCEEHENPADFFLDTIIRYEKESHQQSQVTVLFSAPATAEELEEPQDVSIHLLTDASSSKKVKLAETYCKSVEYQDLRKRIDPMLQNVREEKKKETTAQRIQRTLCGQQSYATSVFWQFLIVTIRSAKNLLRSPSYTIVQLIISIIIAVIIGVIYWQVDTDPNSFNDRLGVFLFIVSHEAFGSLGAIQLFIAQKSLFLHENASGHYRVSAFFVSKVLTDLIALRFLPNTVFALITYFMIGLQVDAERFFIYWLIIMLVNIAAVSLALIISAGLRNGELAHSLITLPFIVSLLFAGLLISLDSLPVWVSWIQNISFMKYGLEALAINEMRGLRFEGPCEIQFISEDEVCNNTMLGAMSNDTCSSECTFDGLDQLSQLGFGNTTAILWWDVFSLVIFALVCMVLAYIVLRLIKKEK